MPLWLHRILNLLPLAALAGAAWVLHVFLSEHSYAAITASVDAVPWTSIAWAAALTVLSFVILTAYDALGVRYAEAPIALTRVAYAAPIAYAFSNSLGISMLTSGALRLRLYRAAGAAAAARITAFCTLTLWLGPILLLPVALAALGLTLEAVIAGLAALALVIGLLTARLWWRRPLTIGGVAVTPPSPVMGLAQIAVSVADWVVAALVFVVLVPADVAPPEQVLAAFLVAQTLGLFSHLPGGIGVFEASMAALLTPHGGAAALAGPLLVYRAVYYLAPLLVAAAVFMAGELWERRASLAKAQRAVTPGLRLLTPPLLGAAVFAVGVVLLLSAVTPGIDERLDFLDDFLPIEVIELSHLVSVAVGIALLFLARGLVRRHRSAFTVTLIMLGVGIVASLLKGADYEEAAIAAAALALLWPARGFFHRRAGVFDLALTPLWIVAIAAALGVSVWLGFYAFRDVPYAPDLLTTTAVDNDAGRFLRALVFGAIILFSGLLVAFLTLRPARRTAPPDPADLAAAAAIVAGSPDTSANLALLGDKSFLFDEKRQGFIMYAASGRSRIALGDPVAPTDAIKRELLWRFLERCDAEDAWPVFYQASQAALPFYLDAGLAVNKLGEDANVDLATFTLDGGAKANLRQTVRAAERRGLELTVAPASEVPTLLDEMKQVSDAWLAAKNVREKGFSLGRFDAAYLSRYPVALVRLKDDGRLVAFANIWEGAGKTELSVDLMRHAPDAPSGLMDFLFVRLLLWGREQGYRRFNLGMAPMAGLAGHRLAPLWHRAGSYIFSRWGALYNFQGLRAYKQKFTPVWEARYLVSPGGAPLAQILVHVAALVSGGLMGAIRK